MDGSSRRTLASVIVAALGGSSAIGAAVAASKLVREEPVFRSRGISREPIKRVPYTGINRQQRNAMGMPRTWKGFPKNRAGFEKARGAM